MGHPLDDQAEKLISGVRVRPARTGREARRVRHGDRHRLARRHDKVQVAAESRLEAGVVEVVVEPARAIEELSHRNHVALRNGAWEAALYGVVRPQPPLGDQLEHDRGDERLRDARDANSVDRPHRPARLQDGQAGGATADVPERTRTSALTPGAPSECTYSSIRWTSGLVASERSASLPEHALASTARRSTALLSRAFPPSVQDQSPTAGSQRQRNTR